MMTKRVERAVIALVAALLVVLFGFSPKSAWAAGEGRARIGDTTYKTVQEAIDSVKPGSPATIELLDNVSGEGQMKFVKPGVDITIDLAGHTYTADAGEAVHINAADVTLTLKKGTINNSTASGYSDGLYAYQDSNNLNLTLDGVTLSSRTQTLAVQGLTSNSNVTIRNSTLSSAEELGIYYPPKSGTLTIEDSTITGTTGIVLKGSALVVKGDTTIHGTGENKVPDDYYTGTIGGAGFNDTGDAVYVESGYNDRPIVVDIQGGTFTSDKAFAVRFFQKEGEQTTYERTIEISGGTFSSDVSEFLTDDVTLVGNDGSYNVVELPDVAEVNGDKYKSFAKAVAAAQPGQTVTLLANASTDPLTIDKGITLDLGGHTLSLTGTGNKDEVGLFLTSGSSTIKNGTIYDGRGAVRTFSIIVNGRDTALTTQDLTLTVLVPEDSADNYPLRAQNGAALTLNSGTTINEDNDKGTRQGYTYGVTVYGNSTEHAVDPATATTLVVNDGVTVSSGAFAVSGNAGGSYENTVMTINGGTLESTMGAAIYHPHYGRLVVNGGVIQGLAGIEMRAGELEIAGGLIKGGDGEFTYVPNGGGSTSDNVALAVMQHTTKLPIKIDISGGTFEATEAFAQMNVQKNEPEAVGRIDLSIAGGEFKGGIYSENFKDADDKGFVSGGSFSDRAVRDYLAPDAAVAVNGGETPYDIFPSKEGALENGGAHTVVDEQGNTWVFADKDAAEEFAQQVGGKVTTIIHTVTFDDCLVSTENTVVKVENGTTVARPAEPVCAGWTFEGWYADASLTTPYDFSAPVTGDITLYAKWSKDAPSISGEEEPQPPADETLTSTGDMVPLVTAVIAAAGAGALGLGGAMRRRMR